MITDLTRTSQPKAPFVGYTRTAARVARVCLTLVGVVFGLLAAYLADQRQADAAFGVACFAFVPFFAALAIRVDRSLTRKDSP